MYMGKPLIVARSGGLTDIVVEGETGFSSLLVIIKHYRERLSPYYMILTAQRRWACQKRIWKSRSNRYYHAFRHHQELLKVDSPNAYVQ